MTPALEALERLRLGNQRFVSGHLRRQSPPSPGRRDELLGGQEPLAIIMGCSDARVPAEMIFDKGLGDLFVVRIAGNIVAPSQVGSVEFAAQKFGTRLVVVLGHSRCGAIDATIQAMHHPPESGPSNLGSIVKRIMPVIESLPLEDYRDDPEGLAALAVRANVRASTDHLRHGSPILEQLILEDGLLVVGAEYSLESGIVDFFDGAPDPA